MSGVNDQPQMRIGNESYRRYSGTGGNKAYFTVSGMSVRAEAECCDQACKKGATAASGFSVTEYQLYPILGNPGFDPASLN